MLRKTLQRLQIHFDPSLELRVQAFYLIAYSAIVMGILVAISNAITGAGIASICVSLLAPAFAFLLLRLAMRD